MFSDDVHQQDGAEAVRQGGQPVRAQRGAALQGRKAVPGEGHLDQLPREQMREVINKPYYEHTPQLWL